MGSEPNLFKTVDHYSFPDWKRKRRIKLRPPVDGNDFDVLEFSILRRVDGLCRQHHRRRVGRRPRNVLEHDVRVDGGRRVVRVDVVPYRNL